MEAVNDRGTVALAQPNRARRCVWTGEVIWPNSVAVRFQTRVGGSDDKRGQVWCSLDALGELRSALQRFVLSDESYRLNPPNKNAIVEFVDAQPDEQSACVCCDQPIECRGFYELYVKSPSHHARIAVCHSDCQRRFCELLERTQEALGLMLGELL